MRRIIAALAAGLLLSGCAAERTDIRAEELQREYAAMGGCRARVAVSIARETETARYTMDVERTGGETHVTVLEPEALAGVGATVSGDALSLTYDGMVLDAGGIAPGVSAVNATDLVLRAVAEGYVTERSTERCEDTDALRLCFETEQSGETLLVTAFFDAGNAPLCAEIERSGEILAFLEFTDFKFGAILPTE